jgi:uncharacterized repeat protein (TIGR01451 family)
MGNRVKNLTLRVLSTLAILSALAPVLPASTVAAPLELPEETPVVSEEPPEEAVSFFDEGYVNVRVVAPQGTDLSKYGEFIKRNLPGIDEGTSVYYGWVHESALSTLRANPYVSDVARIQTQAEVPDFQPDPEVTTRERPSMEDTRARLIELRDNPPQPLQRPEPTGWWDVTAGGHNAQEAWDLGYVGSGVAISVNDSGVDMAHPDFWGTQHRYHNVSGHPYYDYFEGWPVALPPFSNYLMAFDLELNGALTYLNTFAYGPSNFANTSFTGTGDTINFGGDTYHTTGTAHDLNPVYHIGYHPDWSLYAYIWGEPIAILVVDEDGDDVYDTVYVDLNNNKDFRDDKPVHKDMNPLNDYVQGADELAWWDADLDGYPDVSGGMLYFIADGVHCPPFFDVYFGCDTGPHGGFYDPPDNGDLVAFMFVNLWVTDHGQLCASNVVGQGNIDGPAPDGSYPDWKPEGMGGIVQGAGQGAELVPVGDIYLGFEQSVEQAWWFQALGYDGIVTDPATPGGDDSLQASSNSFGPWEVYEDGWDEWSRVPTYINEEINPYTTFFMSSGNTGPGFGTTGSPQPVTAIQLGASSQYGSAGIFEPIASLDQIQAGEAASYYSRGPSANNQLVPHLTANGAWGTGALGLNEVGDGWRAWDLWGGTSRSGPVAMGGGALVMDAYQNNTGQWPDWFTVRQLLMQGANHIYNSPMDGGTGYLNVGRSAAIAGGHYGVSTAPEYWDVGDFEGNRHPGGFAHITEPGDVNTGEFEISNWGGYTATVTVSDYALEVIDIFTHTFTTADISMEDGEFLKPDYFFNIEEIVGGPLPGDTVYAIAELLQPADYFDYGTDDVTDSYFRLNGYDWTDLNADGNLWEDDGDGVVEWDEVDELEYIRFNRAYDESLYQHLPISDPLNRFHDGLFLGIRHRLMSADVPTTPLTLRVVLYRAADWDALDTSSFGGTFDLASGESVTSTVTFTSPMDYGLYQGAVDIQVDTEYMGNPVDYRTIVPVFTQVAYQGDLTAESEAIVFGDAEDANHPYSNGYVRPIQDWWQGRATGGDWRFFFLNQNANPNEPGHQTKLVARTTWDADAPPADVDSYLLGPDSHFSSISNDPNPVFFSSYAVPDGFWGPYSLRLTGKSESPRLSGGHWAFQTDTGSNVDYVLGDFNMGLNGVQIHSHRYDGTTFRQDYEIEVGYVDAPAFLEWDNYGTVPVTLTTNLTFTEDLTVTAFGLSPVNIDEQLDQFVDGPSTFEYDACYANYHYQFSVSDLAQLTVVIDNFVDGDDLDLWLLYDYNDDGSYNCNSEVIGADGTGDPDPETIVVDNPPDGTYWVAVEPYSVGTDGETFDLFITGLEYGETIEVTNLNAGSFGPGDPITFDVSNKMGTCSDATQECLNGFVQVWLEGDGTVPMFDIPVNPRYSQLDLAQSSLKMASHMYALPGDIVTYTIDLVNTSTATGTAVLTDVLPSEVSFLDASDGCTHDGMGTVVCDAVDIPSGGGRIVSTDYEWVDISAMGTAHDNPAEWVGYWSLFAGLPFDDDEGAFYVSLPFNYPFFGVDYTDLYVEANGEVSFDFWTTIASAFFGDGTVTGYDGQQARIPVLYGDQAGPLLPSIGIGTTSGAAHGNVFTYHDDNGTGAPSDDRFIIQWDEWMLSWRPCYYYGVGCDVPYPDNTYQLILYPDGRAKAQYAEINALPTQLNLGTVGESGVENWEGMFGETEGYAWHMTPASGLAWMYQPTTASSTMITITAQITDTLDDSLLCNEAWVDNGHGQVTLLGDCTEIEQADLDVEKTVDYDAPVGAGDTVTFAVDIENGGPLSTTVDIVDTLDAGLTFDSFIAPAMGFTNDGQVITGTAFITAGETFELVYTAEVTSITFNDTLCNDVMVDNGFGTWYYDDACVDVNELDLQYSDKDVQAMGGLFAPGATVTYEVVVSNTSAISTSAWITDYLPSGVTFGGIVNPMMASYMPADHVITAYFDEIGPGMWDSLVFTATIDPAPNGTLVENDAVITDASGEEWDVDADFAVENADFGNSWKEAPMTVIPGEVFTYEVYVDNDGWLSATAMMTDTLPPEVEVLEAQLAPDITYDAGAHQVTWTGWVTNGETIMLEIPVKVLRVPSGVAFNQAMIEGGEEVVLTNETETWIESAELFAEKYIDDPYFGMAKEWMMPWSIPFTYSLYVENYGTVSTTVTVTDVLPSGVEVIEVDLPMDLIYDAGSHTITWQGVIDGGDDVWLHIPVVGTLDAAVAGKELFNQFTATDEWGQVYESDMTRLQLASSEIEVLKFANESAVLAGEEITYTVVIRNVGDAGTGWWGLWEAEMVDQFPDGVHYVPGSLDILDWPAGWMPPHCVTLDDRVLCEFNVEPWGTTNEVRLRYAVRVDQDLTLGTMLTNTVTVNDSYGVMTTGTSVVEILPNFQIYLPIVAKE